jgi:SMC interacting uncharacterized protein involved in chromosome segregation
MDKDKIIEIANDAVNRSNKELVESRDILIEEFEKTKDLIINLTRHLEMVEILYNNVNKEIEKRTK